MLVEPILSSAVCRSARLSYQPAIPGATAQGSQDDPVRWCAMRATIAVRITVALRATQSTNQSVGRVLTDRCDRLRLGAPGPAIESRGACNRRATTVSTDRLTLARRRPPDRYRVGWRTLWFMNGPGAYVIASPTSVVALRLKSVTAAITLPISRTRHVRSWPQNRWLRIVIDSTGPSANGISLIVTLVVDRE